jgi:hypothetical protein
VPRILRDSWCRHVTHPVARRMSPETLGQSALCACRASGPRACGHGKDASGQCAPERTATRVGVGVRRCSCRHRKASVARATLDRARGADAMTSKMTMVGKTGISKTGAAWAICAVLALTGCGTGFGQNEMDAETRRQLEEAGALAPRDRNTIWDLFRDRDRPQRHRRGEQVPLERVQAEILRARDVPLPVGAHPYRACAQLHDGRRDRALQAGHGPTCCTRWAGTRSACPPKTPRWPAAAPQGLDLRQHRRHARADEAAGPRIDWSREFATCDPEYYGQQQALFPRHPRKGGWSIARTRW